MKKILSCFLVLIAALTASAQCNFQLTDYWSNLTTCGGTASVSGVAGLTYGGGAPCGGSSVTVQLQKFNGTTWPVQSSTVLSTGMGSKPYSFTGLTAGEYRIVGSPSPGSSCIGCGFSTMTKVQQIVTVNTAPSASFNVDGIAVNTVKDFYNCAATPLQMNISWSGTSASFGYAYKIEAFKTGGGSATLTAWTVGTPPATFNLKSALTAAFGSPIGQFQIVLTVKNNCNTTGVAYNGYIRVFAAPTPTTSCFSISTNNACSTFATPGTQSSPANVCGLSPKISGLCSGGQIIGGYYRLLIEEFTTGNVFVKTLVNTSNSSISSTDDIKCLDINVLSTPAAYFYTNSTGYKYKVTWTVGNACGESQSVGWFVDNLGGCKTDELTGIEDIDGTSQALNAYPNPATDKLTVTWQDNPNVEESIKLYTIEGKETLVDVLYKSEGSAELNVATLNKGIYILELNDTYKTRKRIVIN